MTLDANAMPNDDVQLDEDPLVPDDEGGADGAPTSGNPQAEGPVAGAADSLFTDEEFARIASNPAELRRLANQRYTERMSAHKDLFDFKTAFDKDPVGTVTQLARRMGVLKDETPAPQQPPQNTVEQATFTRLSKVLGPELAREMTPVILETARAMATEQVTPINQHLQTVQAKAQQAEAARIVKGYFDAHPEAVPHQQAMFSLMNKYVPGPEMSDTEWLDLLYEKAAALSAPKDVRDGKKIAAAVLRSTVQTVRGAASSEVSPRQPAGKGPNKNSKREAFEAALRGERW